MRRLSIERDRHLKINEARTHIQRSREINSTKDELPQENVAKSNFSDMHYGDIGLLFSSRESVKVEKITSKGICCFYPSAKNPQVTEENRRSNFSNIV